MAKNETRRNSPQVISDDEDSLDALKGVEGYDPSNTDYTVAKLDVARDAMDTARAAETQAEVALKAARDAANTKEWAFHNLRLGARKKEGEGDAPAANKKAGAVKQLAAPRGAARPIPDGCGKPEGGAERERASA